jgi:hypothetical protein
MTWCHFPRFIRMKSINAQSSWAHNKHSKLEHELYAEKIQSNHSGISFCNIALYIDSLRHNGYEILNFSLLRRR